MVLGASAASAATWILSNAVFDDGTTLTGQFTVDKYGFVTSYNLVTKTDTPKGFVGFTYASGPTEAVGPNGALPSGDQVQFYAPSAPGLTPTSPDYYTQPETNLLQLTFGNTLLVSNPHNAITVTQSWECESSYVCPSGEGVTRYLSTGFASAVPEPATWAMLLLGAGLIGAGLRFNRRSAVLAA